MSKPTLSRRTAVIALLVAAPLMLGAEYGLPYLLPGWDPLLLTLLQTSLVRLLVAGVFAVLLWTLGYRVLNIRNGGWRGLWVSLPAAAVVINNLPIIGLVSGEATLTQTGPAYLGLFALQALAIGLFEEIAFRGVILLRFAEGRRGDHKGLLLSILLTSAVFGAMHLVNLAAGSSPGAVILQVGYSFLIGAMCSVVLFKTANLWLCVLLHATFDLCGGLVPTLGQGRIWDPITVAITAVLGVAVTVYMVVLFARMSPRELDRIYGTDPAE